MQSGIYKITNKLNNKIYIGSSNNLNRREKEHFSLLKRNKSHCKILQTAWNKYGEQNFIFEVLSTCEIKYLLILEKWFIDNLKPCYNSCLVMPNTTTGYKHTEESKKLMKLKAKGKPLYQYDDNLNFIKIWNHSVDFAKEYKISRASVAKSLRLKQKCAGFLISYQKQTNRKIFNFRRKYPVYQYDENMNLLRKWNSIECVLENTIYKRQSLTKSAKHNVLYKKSYWLIDRNKN